MLPPALLQTIEQVRPPLQTPSDPLGLVQGTSTLHTELAPGNPRCSQRWEHRVSDVCAPRVPYNTPRRRLWYSSLLVGF
eukprot:1188588-Prorocentrum_minimum.AAC.2